MLACAEGGLVSEYTPMQIAASAGRLRKEKKQVPDDGQALFLNLKESLLTTLLTQLLLLSVMHIHALQSDWEIRDNDKKYQR